MRRRINLQEVGMQMFKFYLRSMFVPRIVFVNVGFSSRPSVRVIALSLPIFIVVSMESLLSIVADLMLLSFPFRVVDSVTLLTDTDSNKKQKQEFKFLLGTAKNIQYSFQNLHD